MSEKKIETFRDPLLSLFQSAVSEVAEAIDARSGSNNARGFRSGLSRSASSTLPDLAVEIAKADINDGVYGGPTILPRELSTLGAARVCAEMALKYIKAAATGDQTALSRIQGEFTASTCDAAWSQTLSEYLRYFGPNGHRKAIPYIRASDVGPRVVELAKFDRVSLTGDWGTGASPAMEVLEVIASTNPDVFIHLGDIYYSGTPIECENNFHIPIKKILRGSTDVPVYTLSGNHDMYCGGVGFYDLISKLNVGSYRQPASFFCLRHPDAFWQILAMDTGLHDHSPTGVFSAVTYIEEDELAWHCERIREFDGRTILLSHHQLFSAFSAIGPKNELGKSSPVNPSLQRAFGEMNSQGKVAAWFWGHEHTLSIYKPFLGLERGRCVGHGAVPVSTLDDIYQPLPALTERPEIENDTKLAAEGSVYAHGFASLTLDGRKCTVDYYQVCRGKKKLVYSESFS